MAHAKLWAQQGLTQSRSGPGRDGIISGHCPPHSYLQYRNCLMRFCTNSSLGECFTHVGHQSGTAGEGAHVSLMWECCRGRGVPKGRL